MKLALIVRCKDEPFIHEFVSYYFMEGVSQIFIFDDLSKCGTYDKIDKKYLDRITFIYNEYNFSSEQKAIDMLYQTVKNDNFDWVINVDVDEFITSNDSNSIKWHLENTYKEVDFVKIPWVMMSRNNREKNPANMLKEVIHRWNHDLKHERIESIYKFRDYSKEIPVKSIFKPQFFDGCNAHTPSHPTKENFIVVDSVFNKKHRPGPFLQNINEDCIKNATLLCYHYRIISKEHALNKILGYVYNNFKIDDILKYDYPEIIDTKLKDKIIKYEKDSRIGNA